jgi:hypothetical protein
MSANHLVVKYHNRRMLMTVDLGALFATLFDAYGDGAIIEFAPMDERERDESVEVVDSIPLVQERFRVIETGPRSGPRRRRDLELSAIAIGQK